jgi:hypothetical protein
MQLREVGGLNLGRLASLRILQGGVDGEDRVITKHTVSEGR